MKDLEKLSKNELIAEVRLLQKLQQPDSELEHSPSKQKLGENNLHLIINNIGSPVFVKDNESKMLLVNDAFCNLFDLEKDKMIGKTLAEEVPPEEQESFLRIDKEVLATGKENINEESLSVTGKQPKIISTRKSRFIDANGNKFLVGIIHDITEKKAAEIQINESEEKFRALYDNAPLSYQSLNEDGSFKDINPTWLKTLGYERNEVIGKFYKDLLHPDWQPHFEVNFPRFKKRGYVSDVQFKIQHKAGHYLDISFEGCVGYNPDGSFKQTYCVFKDITEQKKAEQLILKNTTRLNYALNRINVGAWELDLKTLDSWRSIRHDQIFGYDDPLDKWTFDMFLEHVIPEDREEVNQKFQHALDTQTDWEIECQIKRNNDGQIRWIWANGNQEITEQKETIKMFGVVKDITEEKNIEDGLKQTTQLLNASQSIANLGGWELDLETKNLYWTDETYRIHDTSPEEFNPTVDAGVGYFLPESRTIISNALEAAMKYGKGYDLELQTNTTKGRLITVRTTCEVTMIDGKPTKLTGIFQDITEQKKVELAISLSNKKYKSLFEDSPIPLWEEDFTELASYLNDLHKKGHTDLRNYFDKNPDELMKCAGMIKVIDVNQAALDLHQANSKIQLVKEFPKTFSENSLIILKEELVALAEGKGTYQSEAEIKTLQGELKHIYVTLKIDRSQPGMVRAILATSDITEQKLANQELENSMIREQLMANIVRESVVGIAIGYPDGRLGMCNSAYQEITGYDEEELRKIGWNEVVTPPEWKESESAELQKLHRTKKPVKYEKEYIKKDGSRVPIELIVNPQFDNKGEVEFYFAFVIDITDRKQTEQELKKYRENLEDLIKERTQELETKNTELERFNDLFVDREFRIKELKGEIERLK